MDVQNVFIYLLSYFIFRAKKPFFRVDVGVQSELWLLPVYVDSKYWTI